MSLRRRSEDPLHRRPGWAPSAGHLILESASQPGDPTRIASQIITGIGFLGAGAIIRGSGGVSGLSSAATIWFLGAIGILIGCRYPVTGILLALVVVTLLSLIAKLERWSEARQLT